MERRELREIYLRADPRINSPALFRAGQSKGIARFCDGKAWPRYGIAQWSAPQHWQC